MPLGLVRLRTFQLSIWVSSEQTWAQVLTRTQGGCVVHRCQNKNPRTRGCEWRHAPEACAEDLGDFEKSQLSWVLPREKTVDFRLLAEALWRMPHMLGWGRWKSLHRKIEPLSPYVEKPLNSKAIKSFVPELRSRKCFFVFRDSYVIYICALWTLWTFCVPVWICLFHVFMYGYVTHWNYCIVKVSQNTEESNWFEETSCYSLQ